MPNSDKLIKQGIKYTDRLFDELVKRVNAGVRSCDTLEEFLVKYNEYTDGNGENNPLVLNGYRDKMLDLILQETNNHRFSRPSQKELVRVTIENSVGELIVDVGEDVRDSVREVVRDGYNQNLSQDEIATNISNRVNAIKGKRAKAIARTEIARTATISDYVINKERGATHFYVECRDTACPVCKKNWHERWTPENDSTFNPRDESAGGKGWIGDKVYSMNDTGMLPPVHPNCRCVAYFVSDAEIPEGTVMVKDTTTTTTETVEKPVEKTATNEFKTMLQGDYKTYIETDKGMNITVYEFENGFKIGISEQAKLTFEEVVNHINSLPEPLRNIDTLNRIDIRGYSDARAGGRYYPTENRISVYRSAGEEVNSLNTLTHELAHALDNKMGGKSPYHYGLSKVEVYEKIFKEDNKLYTYINEKTGRKRTPNKFPTDYAARNFIKYKKIFKKAINRYEKYKNSGMPDPRKTQTDFRFGEDFADSTKLYLNPETHDKFVKEFPNRAKYLESIYGKPIFDKNAPISKYLELEKKGLTKKQIRSEIANKLNTLKGNELNEYLLKAFPEKEAKAYIKLREKYDEALEKSKAIQNAIGFEDISPLLKLGYSKKEAETILNNPNKYLNQARQERYKYQDKLNELDEKFIKKLMN